MDEFTKQIINMFKIKGLTLNGVFLTSLFEVELLSQKIFDRSQIQNALSWLAGEQYIEILPTGFKLLKKGYDHFYGWITIDSVSLDLMDIFKRNNIRENEYLSFQKLHDSMNTWPQGAIDKHAEAIHRLVNQHYIEEIEYGYRLLKRGKYHIDLSL